MNAIDKLKAKTQPRKTNGATPEVELKPPKKKTPSGVDKMLEGKARGEHLNDKELAIMQFLQGEPDNTGHLKDFMPILLKLGNSDGEYQCSAKYPDSASEGEKRAYRHAQNSTRKLLRIGAIHRIPNGDKTWDGKPEYHPGLYQMWPNRGGRLIQETLAWLKDKDKTVTPMELHTALVKTGDYPSKVATARYVGIKARRWGSILGGTPPNDIEWLKVQENWDRLHA